MRIEGTCACKDNSSTSAATIVIMSCIAAVATATCYRHRCCCCCQVTRELAGVRHQLVDSQTRSVQLKVLCKEVRQLLTLQLKTS
jgi:hypothetical protein